MKQKIAGFFSKTSKENFDFDVNTTSEFGKIQPIMCTEVVPKGKYDFKCNTMVQVAPLLSPLFGRISLRTFTSFVPMKEIFHHYYEVIGKRKVTHGSSVHLVHDVPSIPYLDLLRILFNMQSIISVYDNSQEILIPLNYCADYSIEDVDDVKDYISDIFGEFLFDNVITKSSDVFPIHPASDSDDALDLVLPVPMQADGSFGINVLMNSCFPVGDENVYNYNDVNLDDPRDLSQIILNSNNFVVRGVGNMPTLSNADFVIGKYGPDNDGFFRDNVAMAIRLSAAGRNFRKVLIGLGMQIDTDAFHQNHPLHNKKFSILPFLAYYKAWFDLMYPKRSINFANTNAGKIITYLDATSFSGDISTDVDLLALFRDFCIDLSHMEYVYNNDFFTAHLSELNNNTENGLFVPGTDSDDFVDAVDSSESVTLDVAQGGFTSAGLKLLSAVNNAVLSGTIIGKRVNDYLRQFGVISKDDESNFISSNILEVDTGTVMSMTENDNMFLGQKGGHAEGRTDPKRGNSVDSFEFTPNDFGYIIRFLCVVPKGGFSQGISPVFDRHSRYDFYNQVYDGVGYRLTPFHEFYSSNDVSWIFNNDSEVFANTIGYISRYADYKFKTNIANGDFTRRSTRKAIGSYYLDKRLPQNNVYIQEQPVKSDDYGSYTRSKAAFTRGGQYLPSEALRFCDNALFDFNRVFVSRDDFDESNVFKYYFDPVDDHFIIHMFNDFKAFLPVLPLSESMGADDNDSELQTTGQNVEMS